MLIEKFTHKGVNKDGICEDGGAVYTDGRIAMSQKTGGCSNTRCQCSDGHWIMLALPRTKRGIVEGIKVQFDSDKEMKKFFKNRSMGTEQLKADKLAK